MTTSDKLDIDIDLPLGIGLVVSSEDFLQPSKVKDDIDLVNELAMLRDFSLLALPPCSLPFLPDELHLIGGFSMSVSVFIGIWPNGAAAVEAIVLMVCLDKTSDEAFISLFKSSSSISKGEALLLPVAISRPCTIGAKITPTRDWLKILGG